MKKPIVLQEESLESLEHLASTVFTDWQARLSKPDAKAWSKNLGEAIDAKEWGAVEFKTRQQKDTGLQTLNALALELLDRTLPV